MKRFLRNLQKLNWVSPTTRYTSYTLRLLAAIIAAGVGGEETQGEL